MEKRLAGTDRGTEEEEVCRGHIKGVKGTGVKTDGNKRKEEQRQWEGRGLRGASLRTSQVSQRGH